MNSLCICLVNMNRNNKSLNDEAKDLKEALSPFKNLESIIEHT